MRAIFVLGAAAVSGDVPDDIPKTGGALMAFRSLCNVFTLLMKIQGLVVSIHGSVACTT